MFRKSFILAFVVIFSNLSNFVFAEDSPVLLIGASYASGKMPFNDGLIAPVFGIAINAGSYLDMGQGISQRRKLVINEGQAGATTFQRLACNPGPGCGPGKWDSYDVQLQRALSRVADFANPGVFNTNYVIITMPNDCLHSDAFGIPQTETSPCTAQERDDVASRLIALGDVANAAGVTPVYSIYPKFNDLDLPLAAQLSGLLWTIDEADYNDLRETIASRVLAELPEAILVDSWRYFDHIGDGIHPTKSVMKAALRRIENAIYDYENVSE